MELLQQVLDEYHEREHHRANKQKIKNHAKVKKEKESHSQMFGLPTYILDRFRPQKKEGQIKRSKVMMSVEGESQGDRKGFDEQIFMCRKNLSKYKRSLSPIKAPKNLREYSNLLFKKKHLEQSKKLKKELCSTIYSKWGDSKNDVPSLGKSNTSKEFQCYSQQKEVFSLQVSRFPLLNKHESRRSRFIRGIESHFLTTFHNDRENNRKNFCSGQKQKKMEEPIEISGWENIEAFQC